MVAHRWRRKMKMTITTRPMVSSRVNSTSTTESRIDCERSDIRSTWTDCGTEASRRGIIALMLSTTSTVLAPGWRKISSSSPRLPLNQAPVRGDLVASIDRGDVLQLDRRAVPVGDDDVAVGAGMEELVVGVDGDRLMVVLEVALGLVDGGVGERGAHVLERDAVRGQRRRVGLHAHGEVLLAGHQHLRDAGHRRDLLRQDGEGVVVDLVDRQVVGGHGIDQDGAVGRVDLAVGRRVGQVLGQKPARRVDRRLHVGGGAVDGAVRGRTAG